MRRREFVGLVGGAAAWPLAAVGQPSSLPVVAYVNAGPPIRRAIARIDNFRGGLASLGYVDGRNVVVEAHWGDNQNARFPELLARLVRSRVAVIACLGNTQLALAAKAREHLALFRKNEDLISIGAYQAGGNPALDRAIALQEPLKQFLRQGVMEPAGRAETFVRLKALLG